MIPLTIGQEILDWCARNFYFDNRVSAETLKVGYLWYNRFEPIEDEV